MIFDGSYKPVDYHHRSIISVFGLLGSYLLMMVCVAFFLPLDPSGFRTVVLINTTYYVAISGVFYGTPVRSKTASRELLHWLLIFIVCMAMDEVMVMVYHAPGNSREDLEMSGIFLIAISIFAFASYWQMVCRYQRKTGDPLVKQAELEAKLQMHWQTYKINRGFGGSDFVKDNRAELYGKLFCLILDADKAENEVAAFKAKETELVIEMKKLLSDLDNGIFVKENDYTQSLPRNETVREEALKIVMKLEEELVKLEDIRAEIATHEKEKQDLDQKVEMFKMFYRVSDIDAKKAQNVEK